MGLPESKDKALSGADNASSIVAVIISTEASTPKNEISVGSSIFTFVVKYLLLSVVVSFATKSILLTVPLYVLSPRVIFAFCSVFTFSICEEGISVDTYISSKLFILIMGCLSSSETTVSLIL